METTKESINQTFETTITDVINKLISQRGMNATVTENSSSNFTIELSNTENAIDIGLLTFINETVSYFIADVKSVGVSNENANTTLKYYFEEPSNRRGEWNEQSQGTQRDSETSQQDIE